MMYANKANVLTTCSSRALFLFSRSRVPRVSLSHSRSRSLFSSLESKPSNLVTSALQVIPCHALLKEEVDGHAPVVQQAYYKTKATDPFYVQLQLNKKIGSLKTVQDQLELYCSEPSMNVANRVTLLFNIARIVRRDKEQLGLLRQLKTESTALGMAYVSLLDSISADIPRCSPKHLANVMWSLGNIKEKSHSLVQICEERIMSCEMTSFTPPAICQIVRGCGLLEIQDMFVKLQDAILNGEVAISEFEERDLTQVLYWFVKSDSGSEILFNHFQSEILSRNLMAYGSNVLATFVWLFAKKKVSCPDELFDQIENEVLRRGEGTMQNSSMVTLLWSFAKVGMASKTLFSAFEEELAMRGLQDFDNGQLVQLVWSFAEVRNVRSKRLFSAFDSELALRGLQAFGKGELVQLVWSFAKKGLKDADLYEAVENEVLQRGMSVFLDHQLVILLWSFTKAEKHDTELVKIVLQEFLQRDVKQLNSGHLSQLAWSLGRAEIIIPGLFNSIEQAITQSPSLAMTESEMCALMRSFVEAKEGSSELFNYFRNVIIKDIKSLSCDGICQVLWSFSEDKGNRSAVFSAIEKEILCRGIGSFSTVECENIKEAFFKVEEGSEELLKMLKNVDKKEN